MFVPLKEMNKMVPHYDGKRTSVYVLDDGTVLVKFKNLDEFDKKQMLKKYEYVKGRKIKGVITPNDIFVTEEGFGGYVEDYIENIGTMMSFQDYFNMYHGNVSLDRITDYFISCADLVTECHKEGIVNPDMCSDNNCLYNFEKKEVSFIDFHDMQVKDVSTTVLAGFIVLDRIIFTSKYREGDFWKDNIDYYILAIRYLYYTTNVNVPMEIALGLNISDIIEQVNLGGSYFAEVLRILYDHNKENLNINEAIMDLNDNYTLSEYREYNHRIFLKK